MGVTHGGLNMLPELTKQLYLVEKVISVFDSPGEQTSFGVKEWQVVTLLRLHTTSSDKKLVKVGELDSRSLTYSHGSLDDLY